MRIGTRRSALALAQAGMVAEMLGGCELVPITTAGDRDAPAQDKSRWVAELEQALIDGEIDLAVHSAKDLPARTAPGLALLGAPARAAAEDVLCGASTLEGLPRGARIGTSSIRRRAQLLAAREDLEVVPMRGNVDTRLRRLGEPEGQLAAIVLARAGLQRLQREPEIGGVLDPERFVPAPGQGILALEGREEDARARAAAETVTDAATLSCLLAERALALALQASCNTPLGAHATASQDGEMHLSAWVGLPDGSAWAADRRDGPGSAPEDLGRELASRLESVGAREMLRQAEEVQVARG